MRSTFPRKSHNRSIIGPRIVSVQKLAEEELRQKRINGELTLDDIPIPKNLKGSRIVHKKYGLGTIKKCSENGMITVRFDDELTRELDYRVCVLKALIKPAPKHR